MSKINMLTLMGKFFIKVLTILFFVGLAIINIVFFTSLLITTVIFFPVYILKESLTKKKTKGDKELPKGVL